jgi:hypothetical protein
MKYLKLFEDINRESTINEILNDNKDFIVTYEEFIRLVKGHEFENWNTKEIESLKSLNYGNIASASFMYNDSFRMTVRLETLTGRLICNKREDNNYLLLIEDKYGFRFDYFSELYAVLEKLKVNI